MTHQLAPHPFAGPLSRDGCAPLVTGIARGGRSGRVRLRRANAAGVVERIEVTVTEPVVRYEVADRVATVTLNRPEVAMP